jgi:hypothetical protein
MRKDPGTTERKYKRKEVETGAYSMLYLKSNVLHSIMLIYFLNQI